MKAGGIPPDLRIPGRPRGERVTIRVDGRPVAAYTGETLFAALTAAGIRVLRHASRTAEPVSAGLPAHAGSGLDEKSPGASAPPAGTARGGFCGMGVCLECRVTVDGRPGTRACMTEVRDGMEVATDAP